MNGILFAESIEIEFNSLYEACDNAVAYATARFMESDLYPHYYSEAEEKKSGGLIGFLTSILKSIKDMLSGANKKIKSVLFGSELDESKKDEKVEGRDLVIVTKLITGTIKDEKDALKKAQNGELTIEEAKKLVSGKDAALKAIGTVATTVGALFASSKLHEKYIDSWRQEIDDIYKTIEIDDGEGGKRKLSTSAEKKFTRTSSVEGRENVIKTTTQIIVDHLSKTTTFGIKAIEDNLKILYAKNYIKAKLEKGAEGYTDPKAFKEEKKAKKQAIANERKEAKRMEKETKRIGVVAQIKDKWDTSWDKARNNRNKAHKNRYTDSTAYVDPDIK